MKHLVFDTETTDLIFNSARSLTKQPHIFEIACIIWSDSDDTEMLRHWQIDPGAPISKAATKKTGVTDAMVRGRPFFRTIAPELRHIVENADCVVGHNLSFDKAMVNYEFARIGETVAWPASSVCTLENTEHLKGFRLNLGDLYEHLFSERFVGAHTAIADTTATLRIYRELLKRGEIYDHRHQHRSMESIANPQGNS